jgi:hypothetical protein
LISCIAAPQASIASEAGQGVFHTTLGEHPVHCSAGSPITTPYTNTFSFDDKTFHVNQPPGNNQLLINFSLLGAFASTGTLNCVFDEGGTYEATASNETGDFQWTLIRGEYMDHVPDIKQGDPFPFVGKARCTTTRDDDFKALCDNFELSFNGPSKALEPNEENVYHDFAGDFTLRAAPVVPVKPATGADERVGVLVPVDGADGEVPQVSVTFTNGVLAPGELAVSTFGDAHGVVPAGLEIPERGTTAVDHGSGPMEIFAGGDERFIDISTDAGLPLAPSLEVCLPMPAFCRRLRGATGGRAARRRRRPDDANIP